MLFIPAGDPRKLAKIPSLAAPAFILDLEDAVAHSAKRAARQAAGAAIAAYGPARRLWVRINSLDTNLWEADVHEIVTAGLEGIVVPKVTSAGQIRRLDAMLHDLEIERGLPPGAVALIAAIETVAGLRSIDAIAAAGPRLQCLAFGAGDFCLDVGIDWVQDGAPLSPTIVAAKIALVLASRAANLAPPHDGVYPNLRDLAGLEAEARQARSLGFFGKQAIHPDQLPVITAVFLPSARQIAHARRVVEAFEQSEREGRANLSMDGEFIDYPVVSRARQLLALAAQSEKQSTQGQFKIDPRDGWRPG
jgi:citrate lyase beta subunit